MEINLSRFKNAIAKKYGSSYAYAKHFEMTQCEVSTFLNQSRPVTLKQLEKHAKNLGLKVSVKVSN